MTDVERGWGAAPSARYESLAKGFRPVFARIRARAVERDLNRDLPVDELGWLRQEGFTTLRLPESSGGFGVTLPELFGLIIELSEADPNVTNALRSHFGFTEDILNTPEGRWRSQWLRRIAARETIGSGFSETGESKLGTFSTRLTRGTSGWLLNGEKYYTTGSLYADWINLGATGPDGEQTGALVPTAAEGVHILDDWDGFGQALTASGTIRFDNVALSEDLVKDGPKRFAYSSGFFQLVHLATLAGIGRAASTDVAKLVAERRRVYGTGNGAKAGDDPQILQVVGRVRSAAYGAGSIVLNAAQALQRAYDGQSSHEVESRDEIAALAEVEVSQSVTVVSNLILDATTVLFDALGASASSRRHGLDRHWRNARTIASHNPRIYHDRIVGDFAVNGRTQAALAGVGIADPLQVEKA
jgi:alkylation response protein AidB-like acyl-CoA dehydrogenase